MKYILSNGQQAIDEPEGSNTEIDRPDEEWVDIAVVWGKRVTGEETP